jgi:hypothetical protein
VYIDGFDHQDLNRYNIQSGTPSFVAGRFGGYAMRIATNTDLFFDIPVTNDLSFGFSYYPENVTGGIALVVSVSDASGNTLMQLSENVSSFQTVYYQNSSSSTSSNWTTQPVLNAWQTVEVTFSYGASGVIRTYLNGSLVQSGTGTVRTLCGSPTKIWLRGAPSAISRFDDLWVESGTGAGTRGTRRVVLLTPTSDVTTQWDTTTGANHYSQVADASTATYVATPALTGKVDSFGFSDLGAEITAVEGVMVSAVTRKTDLGTAKLAVARGAVGDVWVGVPANGATASSGASPGNAWDGNAGTNWYNTVYQAVWNRADFGTAVTVDKCRIQTDGATATFILEWSDNDSTWTQVGSSMVIDTMPDDITITFATETHRYWRLYSAASSYVQMNITLSRTVATTAQTVTALTGGIQQQVYQAFETASDGGAWTPAKVNASTFGIVSAV